MLEKRWALAQRLGVFDLTTTSKNHSLIASNSKYQIRQKYYDKLTRDDHFETPNISKCYGEI